MFNTALYIAASILLSSNPALAESTSAVLNCSSSNYRLAQCRAPGQQAVLRVNLIQQISRSTCGGSWNYNAGNRLISVWSGCRANFRVTFKDAPKPPPVVVAVGITDPALPVDYKRNPQLETAILRSLRASSLAPEQLAQHALDRMGFGAGTQPSIRSLVRLTKGEVDETKTHAAILRYVMHSLTDTNYERKDIEQMLSRELPNSGDDYAEVSEKSRTLMEPIRAASKEMARLVELQKSKPSPAVDRELEAARADYQRYAFIFNTYRYTLWEASQARLIANAVNNTYGFKTKLVYLWFNRLNVNAEKVNFDFTDYIRTIAARTHGKFGDMLLASARHPAMLVYLNNYLNRVDDKKGIRPNEDYGRELMELHTLGIPAGTRSGPNSYTLEDVRAASRIMAGWTITATSGTRRFAFVPGFNPTGGKSLLGTSFADGESGGVDFIHFLAKHQSTATSIARMLVRYFVNENLGLPESNSLVEELKGSYLASGGDLSLLYQEMVSNPSFWSASAFRSKVNDPFQQVVKTLRVAGYTVATLDRNVLLRSSTEPGAAVTAASMGLDLFKCTPPTGYSIQSSRWMSANNVLGTIRFAFRNADNDGPVAQQDYVEKLETLAASKVARGEFEAARNYLRAGMQHGYGALWSTARFGYPAAKAELVLANALKYPDQLNRRPSYLRTAAGLFFGSLENSVQ